MINDFLGDVGEVFLIIPELVEHAEVLFGIFSVHLVDEVHHIVTALTAQICGCESIDWSVCEDAVAFDVDEALEDVVGSVGLESDSLANPFCTFYGDGFLGELVTEADFELRAVQGALAVYTGDVEFPALLGFAFLQEGRSRENKAQFIKALQLLTEFVECVYGKTGGGDAHLTAFS